MKIIIIIIIKKTKKKTKNLYRKKWNLATAHVSRRLGAGALGRAGVGAGALGWALGAGLGVQARRQQALGRAGTAWACANGRAGRGRRGSDARQALERGAGERAAGRRGAREAHGVGARGAWPGRAWARLVPWLGQFGAHAASLGFDLGF